MAKTKKAILPTETLFGAPPPAAAKPSRQWTRPQAEAIKTTGTGLLVSAAAGSGKTSVLAERCGYLVCDANPRCNVSQLLVVTFTEAAAAEMKSRIESTLRKRVAAGTGGPDDPHLRRQVKLIEHANVSTLHGFCARLLRQHFHRAGLDPNFAILDGDQASLLRADAVRELFVDRYEADDAEFRAFVDAYGAGNDQPLMELVLQTHELLCSVIDPARWMAAATHRVEEGAGVPLEKSELGRSYMDTVRERLEGLRGQCRANRAAVPEGFPKYAAYLAELSATLNGWEIALCERGYDALAAEAKAFAPARLPTYPNSLPGKEGAALLVTAVRDGMKEGPLRESLNFTAGEWRETLRVTLPHLRTFLSLVAAFGERYAAAKREARGLDFADLERFTLNLLRDSSRPGLVPSAVARTYHHQFAHVLVDEYQDINEVQDAILNLVSTECLGPESGTASNLFCVGDVKQSIYRFRLADPQRFLARERTYRTPSVGNRGRVIDLSSNFRSRGPLLETINDVFARLMTKAAAEIAYDENHKLRPGAAYPTDLPRTFVGAPIELHLIADSDAATDEGEPADGEAADLDRTEVEAHFVANRLAELLGRDGAVPMNVIEREGEVATARPARPGDCVVLLRSPRFKADAFAQALRDRGIPAHTDRGAAFFEAIEVRDVLALLALLDNQRQDIPLAAFLRSPLAALPQPEDALARVRLAYREPGVPVPFHRAVVRYAAERQDELAARLRDLIKQLEAWRTLARERPLAELVSTIYDQTGYLAFCAGLEDGAQRVTNLHALHARARQFGTFNRQGLYRFLRFLESLEEQTDAAAPSVAAASEDVVRILSVHASKGLEFPVVVFPDLGKRHNLADAKGSVLVDRAAFVGMQVMDEVRQVKYPSLAHRLVRDRIHELSMAEELRLLYVALTRAKEHLILVGTCRESAVETWQRKWAGHAGPMPTDAFRAAGSFLDWLGPVAFMLGQRTERTLQIATHTRGEIEALASEQTTRPPFSADQSKLARLEPMSVEPPMTEAAKTVIDRLGYVYPYAALANVPAVQSVSASTKHGQLVPVRESEGSGRIAKPFVLPLRVPACAMTDKTPSATDRGSATHLALQHLDFGRPCVGEDLAEQLGRLVTRRILSPAQREMIDVAAIEWMVGSEAGALLRGHATSLRREWPFYMVWPPSAGDAADRTMVRGRVDVLIPGETSFMVIDYKTDNIPSELVPARAEIYRGQVELYRAAFEGITGKPLGATYLVFLTPRVLHRL